MTPTGASGVSRSSHNCLPDTIVEALVEATMASSAALALCVGGTDAPREAPPASVVVATSQPRGCSSERDPEHSTASEQGAGKPKKKKKRVRRERVELLYLRGQVDELEKRLAQLRSRHATEKPACARVGELDGTPPGCCPIAPRGCAVSRTVCKMPLVWRGLAKRQLQNRLRAQEENNRIRALLREQRRLVDQLQRLLSRQPETKETALLTDTSAWELDSRIFQQQKLTVETALLQMERMLRSPLFSDPVTSFVNTFIEREAGDNAIVNQASVSLPFSKQVTANALWRALTSDNIKQVCYSHQVAERTDDLIAHSIGIHHVTDTMNAHFRCKYTFARFYDGGRVIIAWTALLDPVELNGLKFRGLQGCQTGWINIVAPRPAAESPAASVKEGIVPVSFTRVQSYSRVTLQREESTADQERDVRVLTAFARQAHDRILSFVSPHIEQALVDEDMKQSGWVESLTL